MVDFRLGLYMGASVHLLTAVAIQSVDFSVKSLFIPDSSGAVIKASLEMHAQKTSPS